MISFVPIEQDQDREALVMEIVEEIAVVDRADGREPDEALSAEVAFAVAETLVNECGSILVRRSDLTFLIAKSLWSVGEDVRARSCFEKLHTGNPLSIDAVCNQDSSLLIWQACFSRGLLRELPQAPGGGATWVLDCAKLEAALGMTMELALTNALNAILSRSAFIWDRTRGHGLLGLRRLSAFSQQPGRLHSKFRHDVLSLCRERLELLHAIRHWDATPDVIHWELL